MLTVNFKLSFCKIIDISDITILIFRVTRSITCCSGAGSASAAFKIFAWNFKHCPISNVDYHDTIFMLLIYYLLKLWNVYIYNFQDKDLKLNISCWHPCLMWLSLFTFGGVWAWLLKFRIYWFKHFNTASSVEYSNKFPCDLLHC